MSVIGRSAFVLLACFGVAALTAQARPNFAGDWKLNASKSDFGQFPAPSLMTMKNTHEEPSLKSAAKVASDNGEMAYDLTFSTDGKETANQVGPGEMKTKAVWEGDTLVMTSKGQMGDSEMTLVDKWNLSEDGKTLTIQRSFASSRGEIVMKMVLEKQ